MAAHYDCPDIRDGSSRDAVEARSASRGAPDPLPRTRPATIEFCSIAVIAWNGGHSAAAD